MLFLWQSCLQQCDVHTYALYTYIYTYTHTHYTHTHYTHTHYTYTHTHIRTIHIHTTHIHTIHIHTTHIRTTHIRTIHIRTTHIHTIPQHIIPQSVPTSTGPVPSSSGSPLADTVWSTVEQFVQRLQQVSAAGGSVAADPVILSLYQNLNALHPQLLKQIDDVQQQKGMYMCMYMTFVLHSACVRGVHVHVCAAQCMCEGCTCMCCTVHV